MEVNVCPTVSGPFGGTATTILEWSTLTALCPARFQLIYAFDVSIAFNVHAESWGLEASRRALERAVVWIASVATREHERRLTLLTLLCRYEQLQP